MMRKQRIFSRRYDDPYLFRNKTEYDMQMNPRNLLLQFIHHEPVDWFVENGIPLSVETVKDIAAMETQADLYATFTPEQVEMWREKKIIDKLQNSYNNKQDKTDYSF